jgi:hypothetical protein
VLSGWHSSHARCCATCTHTYMQHHTHSAMRGVRRTIGPRCGSVRRTCIAPSVFRTHTKCTKLRIKGHGAPRVVHGHVACSRQAARKHARAHTHTRTHIGAYRRGGYQSYDHHRHHSLCRQAGAPRLRIRSTAVSAAAAITSGAMAAGHNHRATPVSAIESPWSQFTSECRRC